MRRKDIQKIREALSTVVTAKDILIPALKEKHGTYRAVAKELGITNVHLSNLKRGFSDPSIQLLYLMVHDLQEDKDGG